MATYTKGEITEFVKQLIKTDRAIATAIDLCNSLTNYEMFRDLDFTIDEDIKENLDGINIANKYVKLSGNTSFAEPDLYERIFQDYECFTSKLQVIIDSIEV